jgi:hypothetical protein
VGLTTRPPGAGTGVGPAETAAAPSRELRALITEIRALASASARALPAWPELRGPAHEPALARWFRTALGSAGLAPAALKELVEAAAARLAAGAAAAEPRALEAARDAVLRLLAVATAEVAGGVPTATATPQGSGAAESMAVLAEAVAIAVAQAAGAAGASPAPPAGATGEPSVAARSLAGWLRAEAARSGMSPARLALAVEAGVARALEVLTSGGAGAVARAAIESARAALARELAVDDGTSGPMPLLYRPEVPQRLAAGAPRVRVPGGHERVLPVGEEERAPSGDGSGAPAGEDSAGSRSDSGADSPTEGPMRCIRRTIEALLAGDTRAYTAQWLYPACFWIDGQWLACPDETALAEFQARLRRARHERGAAGGRILLLRVDPVGDSVALVHLLLSEERSDGDAAREVEALYTTVRTAAGWRVAAAFSR